jgi:acyl carrier protein
MDNLESVKQILKSALQLGERADRLTAGSALLGTLPEFDSMAVVAVLTMIEDHFGVTIADDEIDAATFETLGSLVQFVDRKTSS